MASEGKLLRPLCPFLASLNVLVSGLRVLPFVSSLTLSEPLGLALIPGRLGFLFHPPQSSFLFLGSCNEEVDACVDALHVSDQRDLPMGVQPPSCPSARPGVVLSSACPLSLSSWLPLCGALVGLQLLFLSHLPDIFFLFTSFLALVPCLEESLGREALPSLSGWSASEVLTHTVPPGQPLAQVPNWEGLAGVRDSPGIGTVGPVGPSSVREAALPLPWGPGHGPWPAEVARWPCR